MITEIERYQGALLGLAAGDAVGTTLEFSAPGSFEPINDMVGSGPFNLKPGQWTDDTSMALCLAESLVESRSFDARDQMDQYVRWMREGYLSCTGECFDIGNTVSHALNTYLRTGNPLAGSTDPKAAGNGSLMRLVPAPLFFARDPEKAVRMSAESSRTTHGAITCIDACRYFGGLITGAVSGASKDELLTEHYSPAAGLWDREPLCQEIDEIARGSFMDKNPPDIRGSGYLVESLVAALWAFYNGSDFREGCLLAVNLGEVN